MRTSFLFLLPAIVLAVTMPVKAEVQSQTRSQPQARDQDQDQDQAPSPSQNQEQADRVPFQPLIGTAPPSPLDVVPDVPAEPLAARGGNRIFSKNEQYNLSRVAEGRLGVRLGNDLSFRITGN